ncbi:complement component C8 gamma chain isoform X2 [Lemur catta]|uniref:complement component C8 gamma chain isoform X2 n=1 Tax=Lemur catta TaxID=9447 RepID=UPI001E267274|nr:complement component C8 gamma chain isoform X2 [Lemur catta]
MAVEGRVPGPSAPASRAPAPRALKACRLFFVRLRELGLPASGAPGGQEERWPRAVCGGRLWAEGSRPASGARGGPTLRKRFHEPRDVNRGDETSWWRFKGDGRAKGCRGTWTNSWRPTWTLYAAHGARDLPGGAGRAGPVRRLRTRGGTWASWAGLLAALDSGLRPRTQRSASPSPVTVAAMPPSRTVLLVALLLAAGSLGQGPRRPPRRPAPVGSLQPQAGFDARQFAGTWLLVAVGSACRVLREQGHRAEATALHVAPQGTAMAVSTFRKLDGICWQVRQLYRDTGVPGRFLLQARGARGAVHVVVAETDYQGFAILYLERAGRLSVKLYARSLPVSDSILSGFERRVQEANLTEDQVLFFPKYGFCEAADQFHILDGEWAAGPGQPSQGHVLCAEPLSAAEVRR